MHANHYYLPLFGGQTISRINVHVLVLSIFLVCLTGICQASDRALVEEVISRPWKQVANELRQTGSSRSLKILINAPLSGFSEGVKQNLLTFAGFNRFPELVRWGVELGADVNLGDGQGNTLLITALSSGNREMLELALELGSQVNIQAGLNRDTLLSALMRWEWPVLVVAQALNKGAQPRTEEERQELLAYVARDNQRGSQHDALVAHLRRIALIPKAQLRSVVSANSIDVNMQVKMDKALRDALVGGSLAGEALMDFGPREQDFSRFLVRNMFSRSLRVHLARVPPELAREWVLGRDGEGYDLLLHALKVQDSRTVEVVLGITPEGIGRPIPDEGDYLHGGQWPMHLAVMWRVPDSVFKNLKRYGGVESLSVKNAAGKTPLMVLKAWRNQGIIDDEAVQRILRQLQIN